MIHSLEKTFARGAAVLITAATIGLAGPAAATSPDTGIDPAATLFSHDDEAAGERIGWYINDVGAAYAQAALRNKPLVFIWSARWCTWCNRYVRETLACPKLNSLAGQAVFAISERGEDPAADKLAERLEIKKFPATSVLAPDREAIREILRLNGFMPDERVARLLSEKVPGVHYDPASVPQRFFLLPLTRSGMDTICR